MKTKNNNCLKTIFFLFNFAILFSNFLSKIEIIGSFRKGDELNLQTKANELFLKDIKNQERYNYMSLKINKQKINYNHKIKDCNHNEIDEKKIYSLTQQFFQLSDNSVLNIKHLDLNSLNLLQKTIAIEPVKIRNYYNMQYYANIFVGSEKEEFTVIIDTGSNILWLPSTNCTMCRNYTNKYDENLSISNKLLNKTINITYGKGFVEGDLFSDDVYIAENFGVKNMHFLSVDKELELDGTVSDGLLGLGIYFENNKNFSFIHGLYSQGLINKPIFTFYLTDSAFSNRLYIGDIRENKNLENFWSQSQGCDVNNNSEIFSKYWACDVMSISTTNETFEKSNLDFMQDKKDETYNNNLINYKSNNNLNINLNNENININANTTKIIDNNTNNFRSNYQFKTNSKAIFDTGSSLVFIPPNDFLNLIPYFNSKALNNSCTLSYSFQLHCKCNSPQDFGSIYLNFGKGKFIIDFEIMIDYIPNLEFQCQFQMILDLFNFDTWILGDSVLRYSFITFDIEKREISFLQNSGMITDNNIIGNDNICNILFKSFILKL